jgi:hypothetical protein
MNMRRFVGILLASLAFFCVGSGCRKEPGSRFEDKLVSEVTTKCQNRFPCTFRMKDITDFGWDKMYVFKYTARRNLVEKVLGTSIHDFKEFHRKIVFSYKGNVVLYEEEPTNVEHPIKNEVAFDIPDTSDYREYGPGVLFSIDRIENPEGAYYQLRAVQL